MTPDDLQDLLEPYLPDGVRCAVEGIEGDHGLTAAERSALPARSVPARWASFAAGRRAARRAFGQQIDLLPGPSGAPCWPEGWDGSLSHDGRFAVALVTRAPCPVAIDLIDFQAADAESYHRALRGFAAPQDTPVLQAPDAARLLGRKEVAVKLGLGPEMTTLTATGDRVTAPDGRACVYTRQIETDALLITIGQRG